MSRRVSRIALAAIASCALAAFVVALLVSRASRDRDAPADPAAARGAPRALVAAGPARGAPPPLPPRGDAARAAVLDARLAATARVIYVPDDRAPAAELPPLPGPLPPEVEREKGAALAGWTREAQRHLDACLPRREEARGGSREPSREPSREVALDVMFAPGPRASGEARQPLEARIVTLEPSALRRLWDEGDPDRVDACLTGVRAIPLVVSLSAEALTHQFPSSAERLLVRI